MDGVTSPLSRVPSSPYDLGSVGVESRRDGIGSYGAEDFGAVQLPLIVLEATAATRHHGTPSMAERGSLLSLLVCLLGQCGA